MCDPPDRDKEVKPAETTVAHEGAAQLLGATIGPYRLMEKIGEGGFGIVFVAEQLRPVKRRVALKLIKPGMDSREVIARFEAERQALALMEHPNIARVLDAGTTDSGHPYFVMELVRGVPITDYCDRNRLTLRERLELFVAVCHAIQHAHQKGIIHRDIKPSNVLVTLHDGSPVVKVIDFGVAKALHQQLTDKTIYTRFAQVIGTPLYMSPEQAEMSGLDIDTRSDIYSLGVLLYELLTGTTPFDSKRLAEVAFDERIRIIRNEEPPKPSTRLRQSSETLPSIAAQRRIEPAKLSKMFRGDLDWITMTALEKDRTRRYPTASALATDVLHYLHDEPVEATPPSRRYLVKKFARRYRTFLATAASFVALLIVGVVVSSGLAIREQSARRVAEAESRRADENAESARGETELARSAQRLAEAEKQVARLAEAKAVAAQKALEQALDRAQRSLYLNQIALVERNWQANNPNRAVEILDACPRKFRDWEWRYFNRLVHAAVLTMPGDNAVYSPDGKLLAVSDKDKAETIQLFDAETTRFLMSRRGGHPLPSVQSLIFSPDSRRLAGVSAEGAIWIWSLSADSQTRVIPVRLSEQTVKHPLDRAIGLAFSPDGGRIALAGVPSEKPNETGDYADNLMVWDAFSGKELFTVPDMGRSVAFSPDGQQLATTSFDFVKIGSALRGPFTEGIRILNAATGQAVIPFPAWQPDGAHSSRRRLNADDSHLVYSPDGNWLASARGNEIKIWDARAGKEVRTLRGHAAEVTSLCFSSDSTRLGSGSQDETVRIWDPAQGEALVAYRGHVGTVARVSFRPDGKFVVSTGEDGTVRIWPATAQQGPREIPGTAAINGCIGVSPDGRLAACFQQSTSSNGRFGLVLIESATSRILYHLRAFDWRAGAVYASLAFGADGRLLASAFDKDVQIWEVATGRELARIPGLSSFEQRGLALPADGAMVAFATADNALEVWSVPDRKRLRSYRGHHGSITTIAFSPHCERLASASTDGTVKVWDLANDRELFNLKGTRTLQAGLAFSPDGNYLLASGPDNSVYQWELTNGKELRALHGHKSNVGKIAFSPTGTRLITSGSDQVVRLWTWPECEEILSLRLRSTPVSASFTADGKKLLAAGEWGVTVWDATPTSASNVAKD